MYSMPLLGVAINLGNALWRMASGVCVRNRFRRNGVIRLRRHCAPDYLMAEKKNDLSRRRLPHLYATVEWGDPRPVSSASFGPAPNLRQKAMNLTRWAPSSR